MVSCSGNPSLFVLKAQFIWPWMNTASFLYFGPIPAIKSHSYIFNVHHLFGNFMFLSLRISVCKSKTQPNQTSLNLIIIIWHCFSIFADLCFCFQPFFIKKGFPTPSELEERAVLFLFFFLKSESPCFASPDRGEIIYWGRTALCSFGPGASRHSGEGLELAFHRTVGLFVKSIWVFDDTQIRLWDWL